ncbi:multiple epidermal growth factor-like domains protein 6 [Girardinichthys multiradiatus]|uniref:multiple epidermal growth factor-like domains protein 6 n=1 Tax=Girardinichthys multiradiatus TaxID=208333 RepID=UPI001FAD5248|nr:multiple epidermal growth factor-like domains protein 6 [Girardinichthys multiradiatus]
MVPCTRNGASGGWGDKEKQGYFCPRGTKFPQQHPCPVGTWSSSVGGQNLSSCWACAPRFYCNSTGLRQPSGICDTGAEVCDECPPGTYCLSGEAVQPCPAGHYCLGGGVEGILPCPPGTYSPRLGLRQVEQCLICPAGFYCDDWGLFEPTGFCHSGYYCIAGTKHATQFPCPRGYYNPEPMTQSLDSCLPCPPGHYCEKERLTKVSGKCKAGWFCVSAAWNSQPFDLDNYTNANCLCPATSTGGRCQVGFYCPLGSSEPLPCPPGTFCNKSGLALPVGPCSPGYYCVGGATEARPTDVGTGNICPPGTYCVEGSGEPEMCPPGSFSSLSGLTNEASCQPCTAGFYCGEEGLRAPTGPCSQGYWCPPGQSVATALPCPSGHFCLEGSSAPEPCPSGTYQDRNKQGSCMICEAGEKNINPF